MQIKFKTTIIWVVFTFLGTVLGIILKGFLRHSVSDNAVLQADRDLTLVMAIPNILLMIALVPLGYLFGKGLKDDI